MSGIVRLEKRERFTVVDNDAVRDARLSFRATGLLIYLLSLPDNWKVESNYLAGRKTEGRDAVRKALQELEEHGYLKRGKRQNTQTGRWERYSTVYEYPLSVETDFPTPDIQAEVGKGSVDQAKADQGSVDQADKKDLPSSTYEEVPSRNTYEEVPKKKSSNDVSNIWNLEVFDSQGEDWEPDALSLQIRESIVKELHDDKVEVFPLYPLLRRFIDGELHMKSSDLNIHSELRNLFLSITRQHREFEYSSACSREAFEFLAKTLEGESFIESLTMGIRSIINCSSP